MSNKRISTYYYSERATSITEEDAKVLVRYALEEDPEEEICSQVQRILIKYFGCGGYIPKKAVEEMTKKIGINIPREKKCTDIYF